MMSHRDETDPWLVRPDPGDGEFLTESFDKNMRDGVPRVSPFVRYSVAIVLAVAVIFLLLAWGVWQASAQQLRPLMPPMPQMQACGSYAEVVARLAAEYHEELTFAGVTNEGHLMELYASSEAGTWTILNIHPQKVACIAVAGKGFEAKRAGEAIAFKEY